MPFLPEDPNPPTLYRHPEGLNQAEMQAHYLALREQQANQDAIAAIVLFGCAVFGILVLRWLYVKKRHALAEGAITAAAWSVRGGRFLSGKASRFRQRIIDRSIKR